VAPRLVVLGWDSATFDVIDPLLEAGRLPALASVVERGTRAPLASTWPPITDCAWTSAFTGRNPGGHGIFGSWYRAPGRYEMRYFSSRDRKAPALWELADDVRFLVWNVPMTYPPTDIDGVMVAGYGAPPGSTICAPSSFQSQLAERWPLDDLLDRAPHGSLERFLEDLLRGLEVQAKALPWAAQGSGADCVVAVWPHVDRAQHFFWRFRGTDHPLESAVDRVYEAMDAATGAVLDAFPGADIMIVSDHGAGPLRGDVNVGAWLAHNGFAVHSDDKKSRVTDVAWALPPSVRRLGRKLAPGLARKTMAATLTGQLGPFEWSRTKAFVGFHGDLWLNLKGREAQGIVDPIHAGSVLDEIASGLLDVRSGTGEHVFHAVHKRDEIYSGAELHLAPDAILDSWSSGYRVAPKRKDAAEIVIPPLPLAGVEESWSSDHRPEGIFVAAGPRMRKSSTSGLRLYDVCPTALALLERPVPSGLDGRVAQAALDDAFLAAHPVAARGESGRREAAEVEYSADEAAAVAAHLKDLGYIE
jgi:predicted AlkP superfamily phosphohydrolase/phosphomutase